MTPEQIKKIRTSLNLKINSADLILIPHKIKTRCILNAKSSAAKQRLILIVEESVIEDMKRLHIQGYSYKNRKDSNIFSAIKDLIIKKIAS